MNWSVVEAWAQRVADAFYASPVDWLHLIAVVMGLLFVWAQIRYANVQRYIQIMLDAERDYEKLHRRILEDADLTADYMAISTDGPIPPCPRGTPGWQKRFVFWELYYGHLCKVYTLHHVPRFNPLRSWRVSRQYWKLYENWLTRLVRHPIFVDVHEAAKRHETYERAFVETVERVVRKASRKA